MKGYQPRTPPNYNRIREEQLQRTICDFLSYRRHPRLIYFHVPNSNRVKRPGLTPGVADLVFGLPSGKIAFMELKTLVPFGRLSIAQRAFQLKCDDYGFPYVVVRSLEEAEEVLTHWGALRDRREERRAA